MDHDSDFRTWNIFHRRHNESLCCAVPADIPVPLFLMTGEWTFGCAIAAGDPPVAGFSAAAAQVETVSNGFYLFLAFAAPSGRWH